MFTKILHNSSPENEMTSEVHREPFVKYNPAFLFYFVAIVPILTIGISLLFYYINHHNVIRYFPSILEFAILMPERRIFSVGMNTVSWLSIPIFLLFYRIFGHCLEFSYCFKYTYILSSCVSFFSLLALSSVTLRESKVTNQLFAFLFSVAILIFIFTVDYGIQIASFQTSNIRGYGLDIASLILLALSVILKIFNENVSKSIGFILQFLGFSIISFKFLDFYSRFPKSSIILIKKPTQ